MIPHLSFTEILNFKSLGKIQIPLEPFTVFVGPNGTGKSNFLDAFSFVQQCLSQSIEYALISRGGISAVRRHSTGHPKNTSFLLAMSLEHDFQAHYFLKLSFTSDNEFKVEYERCDLIHSGEEIKSFSASSGRFLQKIPGIMPKISPDRLALFAASATEEFRPVYDFLTSMRFYSIVPDKLRELQDPDAGEYLKRDGSNAASVLKRILLEENKKEQYDIICRLLAQVSEGVSKVEYMSTGNKETLQFRKDVGTKHPWKFDTLNMSDGTLRALGLLLAAYQTGKPTVIGIEEPESTVHPAVMELIVQVLMDAAKERQILITTHSPDILDQKELSHENIRVVTIERGRTLISPVSESGRQAIREKLYTPGELLRIDELNPDLDSKR